MEPGTPLGFRAFQNLKTVDNIRISESMLFWKAQHILIAPTMFKLKDLEHTHSTQIYQETEIIGDKWSLKLLGPIICQFSSTDIAFLIATTMFQTAMVEGGLGVIQEAGH